MSAHDIVAYTYRTETLCPDCLIEGLIRTGWAAPAARDLPVEEALDQIAGANAIDREDERSFDSGDFPKVVLEIQVESPEELCGSCGEPIVP
ncbi:hypothetical protein E3_0820 [Rhodococcus phage E3]|uniref:hypothetical protein n=1 Tax=Rhodococcus phage E3 TaxID=1007869 RepID=UPI0002C6B1BD|nr:hypothetical protein M176_gp086 [Rhodococcus phage E3]AEQ20995.1 hypothetical protein E3_0820 [Rhodococcus phage E3]